MLKWMKAQLGSERIEYEADQRLVLVVLGVSFFATLLLFIANISRGPIFILDIALVVAFVLALRGKLGIAGLFGPLAALVVCTLLMLRNFGIRDTAVLGLPVVIVAASLMNGQKGALAFGIASLMVVIGIGVADLGGFTQNNFSIHNSLADYVVVCIVIILTFAMQWAVLGRIMLHIRRMNHELSERVHAEEGKAAYAQEMEALYQLSLEISELPPEKSLDEFFACKLKELTQAMFVSLAQYNLLEKKLEIRQLIMDNQFLNQGIQILGIDPRTMSIPVSEETYQQIIRDVVGYHQNLSEATFGAISPALASTLQTIFKMDKFVGLGILYDGKLEASILFGLQEGSAIPSERFLKAMANLAAMAFWRKKTEQSRLESETRFQQMAELLPQGIIECDRDGFVTYANQQAGVMVRSRSFTPGDHFLDLFDKKEHELVLATFQAERDGSPGTRSEFQIIRRDGSRFPALIYSSAIISNGQNSGTRAVIVDISEFKQRENESQAIASLSAALRIAPNRAEMLPLIVEQLAVLFNYNVASIEIIDPLTGDTVLEAAHGIWKELIGKRQKSDCGINAIIRQTRQPFFTADLEHEERLDYSGEIYSGLQGGVGMPLFAQDKLIGFVWVGRKADIAVSEVRLFTAVADMAANAIYRATMHEQSKKDAADLTLAYDTTLEGWAHALELRDQETEGHTRRVMQMTVDLARKIGVDERELENVRRGALLHDIGKMGIPDSVLLKPGTLNESEWEIMRRHPEYAQQFLETIEYLRPVLDIPYCHHEKWDGTGYPRGLKGAEIPFVARIFAIVDVWDALRSDRPYRKAWASEKARAHIVEQSGTHFDPQVVQAFLELLGKAQV